MEETTITRLDNGTPIHPDSEIRVSQKQLMDDCQYLTAQKMTESLLESGLISRDEFNRITEKNRESFMPYLSDIMPKLS